MRNEQNQKITVCKLLYIRTMHIENVLSVSQSCHEPLDVSLNYCAYPITRLIYPGLPKPILIHSALVNQADNLFIFVLLLLYLIVPTILRTNTRYTHTRKTYLDTCFTWYPALIFSRPAATAAVSNRRARFVFLASALKPWRSSCNKNAHVTTDVFAMSGNKQCMIPALRIVSNLVFVINVTRYKIYFNNIA